MAITPRVLIVDDELPIQRLVSGALIQQGFECDVASDGRLAAQLITQSHYDAVVTDLKMPQRHGHALALDLLELADRPAIVIHTGVLEPKLAKDLLGRGVDDILFKPTDFGILAAKVRALVDRRRQLRASGGAGGGRALSGGPPGEDSADGPVTFPQLNARLAEVAGVLPISKAALDVYNMTRSEDWALSQIGAAIQRDASLTAEVLRLANSSLYNPSGQRIVRLDQALLRVGQRRVGELALTANAMSAVTSKALPWMNLELAWKRSMAAGLALESLVELGGHQELEEGLQLSAIMYPLGRVVLGMLFPRQYEVMLSRCHESGETLQAQERRDFPTSHVEIMAHLLATWRIPPDVFLPLKFCLDEFASLARLTEPTRTRAELVKTAILLGRLAVDRWESWDVVQLPGAGALERLGVTDVAPILRQTRADLSKIAEFHPGGGRLAASPSAREPTFEVAYVNLSSQRTDLLVELFPSLGLAPRECTVEELTTVTGPAIVNGTGPALARFGGRDGDRNVVVVTDLEKAPLYARLARVATLPSSYGRLRQALGASAEKSAPSVDSLLSANA